MRHTASPRRTFLAHEFPLKHAINTVLERDQRSRVVTDRCDQDHSLTGPVLNNIAARAIVRSFAIWADLLFP
jgi:hypothetical protein